MRISGLLEGIAKSKVGQKVYGWAAAGNHDRFLNNTLPQLETIFATSCYIYSTAKQKNLDPERKKLLQIQNVGSGVVGLILGSAANHWVSNKADAIIKDIDTTKFDPKSLRKISTGLRVGLPILTTCMVMRFLIPSVIAMFSGKMMDKDREKKKLNVQA